MQKAYDRIIWQNLPSRATALEADNLNAESTALDTIDDRVVAMDTTKANQTDMLQTISNITFDRETGIFTITRYNGTSFTIDTDLEKIAVNFDYDPVTQQLILTLIDGTVKYIDLSELITQFEFLDTSTIHFDVNSSGQVTASIIPGSITENMLQPNFLADCRLEVDKAEGFADEANAWANGQINGADVPSTHPAYENNAEFYSIHAREEAEAWAVGKRSGVDVPPTDETYHNNSKFHSEQAGIHQENAEAWAVGERNGVAVPDTDETYHNSSRYHAEQSNLHAGEAEGYKNDAADILEQINIKINQVTFAVNFLTGDLEYSDDTAYMFNINTTTGNLEWEVVA